MQNNSNQMALMNMMTTTPPAFSDGEAIDIAATHFGIKAQVRPLVSERDQNFRLETPDGQFFTLKIANDAEQLQVIDFQSRALIHVAAKDASFPVPRVIPTLDGQLHCSVERAGKTHLVRVFSWLEGTVMHDATADAALANQLGRLLARLNLALKDFEHPGSNPPLLWDMKRAENLRELPNHIDDPKLKQLIDETFDRFVSRVKPALNMLRTQVIHNDLNLGNVLMDQAQPGRVSGFIDFGDLVRSPLIIDLAVAAAYQLGEGSDPLDGALPMIAGYHAICPLQPIEMELLKDLIQTRLITSLMIGAYRARLFPENREYILTSFESSKNALISFNQLDADEVLQRIQAACNSV